jgi:hypothetical protein
MGPENWPWVLAIVRAIDRFRPGTSADAITLILRDVYVYCTRHGIADAIDEIVRADIVPEPTVARKRNKQCARGFRSRHAN